MISGKAKLAGVMGWPVGHSLSPLLHGFWLRELGIDGTYVPLAVTPEDCAAVLKTLPRMGFQGCNVTVPHKETALATVDEVDHQAQRIGAVNTVVVAEDGRLLGRNTDAYGFMANLQAGLADWSAAQGPAVVLGAGGAARAVIVGLLDAGCPEIRLTNRTRNRAEAVAGDIPGPITVTDWDRRSDSLEGAALLVNTTTLGMAGQPPLEMPLDGLSSRAVVTDIVYAPLQTVLLRQAAERGHRTVDGLGMLLHQAVPGFEAWFGPRPEVSDALRRHMLDSLG
ncbi:shikimate dehydrogenase [Magnetospira sp. QH-2]|uniref:shikimate dehydrogenase n=1 Tax=Magnetospira sp. (strain QH-2) TaxID=1288970 RepID=UPI0003E814C2|nr:shikimate dehydrogenase [Magnetospira sp. QH-2]CCQ75624.1 Shikimate dehydrogenase [Magnetospira sp. QH-2]